MKCPRDQVELVPETHRGIEVDRCPQHSGRWLDHHDEQHGSWLDGGEEGRVRDIVSERVKGLRRAARAQGGWNDFLDGLGGPGGGGSIWDLSSAVAEAERTTRTRPAMRRASSVLD